MSFKELTISSLDLMLKKEKASLLSPSPTGNEVILKEDDNKNIKVLNSQS